MLYIIYFLNIKSDLRRSMTICLLAFVRYFDHLFVPISLAVPSFYMAVTITFLIKAFSTTWALVGEKLEVVTNVISHVPDPRRTHLVTQQTIKNLLVAPCHGVKISDNFKVLAQRVSSIFEFFDPFLSH